VLCSPPAEGIIDKSVHTTDILIIVDSATQGLLVELGESDEGSGSQHGDCQEGDDNFAHT
jgi:hypothetical protein